MSTPPWHLPTPPQHPQMRIKDFNSDNSYLPSLTCNMDVRVHIGRSNGRSTPLYWHLVANNGNFRFHISRSSGRSTPLCTDIQWPRMAISGFYCHTSYKQINWQIYPPHTHTQMHYGIYIMGYIWQPFWILQEKVGIFFHFSIIWVVNSQLAL